MLFDSAHFDAERTERKPAMTNTLTFVDYNEATDEFTIHLKNENVSQTIDASVVHDYWEAYRCGDSLSHFDTAIAQIYDDHYQDQPQDLLNQSADF